MTAEKNLWPSSLNPSPSADRTTIWKFFPDVPRSHLITAFWTCGPGPKNTGFGGPGMGIWSGFVKACPKNSCGHRSACGMRSTGKAAWVWTQTHALFLPGFPKYSPIYGTKDCRRISILKTKEAAGIIVTGCWTWSSSRAIAIIKKRTYSINSTANTIPATSRSGPIWWNKPWPCRQIGAPGETANPPISSLLKIVLFFEF